MEIDKLVVNNFIRLRYLEVDFTTAPIHLFCGSNEAGKTSVQEAIRFVLRAEKLRVSLVRDNIHMITDGAKSGSVSIVLNGTEYERDIKTGKGSADQLDVPMALDYLLDSTRYTWLKDKPRRDFIFRLLNIGIKKDLICERMKQRRVPQRLIDILRPMLSGGFDPAHKEAVGKVSQARAGWRAITNETYGAKKAPDWEVPQVDAVDNAAFTAAVGAERQAHQALEAAQEALSNYSGYPEGIRMNCPGCGIHIAYSGGEAREFTKEEAAADPSPGKREDMEAEVQACQDAYDLALGVLAEYQRNVKFSMHGEETQAEALVYHKEAVMWSLAAEALAPDGIPAEIVSDRLEPLNERLMQTAMITKWAQVAITPNLELTIGGRSFQLQSESAQWRAQAAIAEAISVISGIGLLVLDRIDVLDLANRSALLKWVIKVAPEHKNILLFGTLKEAPKLPKAISVHWLEGGEEV